MSRMPQDIILVQCKEPPPDTTAAAAIGDAGFAEIKFTSGVTKLLPYAAEHDREGPSRRDTEDWRKFTNTKRRQVVRLQLQIIPRQR